MAGIGSDFNQARMLATRGGSLTAKVNVILLNWNGWKNTSACLSSLQSLRYENHAILVVDNGSTDDSVIQIRENYPSIEVIETGQNLGFAGGCNVGIRRSMAAGAEFVWLLNNDTTVDPDALTALVCKAMSDSSIGVVGSSIFCANDPSRLQAWGGGYINYWMGHSRHYPKAVPDDSVQFITGASMLIRREAIEHIGLFDDEFFMYWEDADYCFRLRDAKFRLAVAGDSKIWHEQFGSVGRGSARLDEYFNASATRFFSRYAPVPAFTVCAGALIRAAKRGLLGDWRRLNAVLNGVRQGILSRDRAHRQGIISLDSDEHRF